jgi:ATP-binding cassette subfamily B protein
MAYKAMAFFTTGMGFFMSLLNIVVLGLGGFFASRGIISPGELIGFMLYINLVMQPIRRLTNFTQQFEQGMTGFMRFDEIMRQDPEFEDGESVLKDVRGSIQFKNVSFSYDAKEQVLNDISFEVEPGTNIALVGSSGGGKTTICHLIPRFYDVVEGEILVDGTNIKEYTLESLRGNIGLVQQDVFLFTGTVGENILYGRPGASYEEMVAAAKKADIHDFIEALPDGYNTWVGEKGVRLSGGQKQRISIARVFLKNPPILLLDEATSSLDNETEAVIQESLEELTRGRTSMVIAHRLSTIRNADIIFVLSDEGIVERGSHKDLYAKEDGIYRRLYDAQFFAEQNKPHLFD